MASLVLLNVSQTLVEQIRDWGKQRRLGTDDAAIALLRMAVESTPLPQAAATDDRKEIAN
jgi:hypothetical protein